MDYGGGVGSTYLELEMSMESIEHIEYDIYDSLISCEGGKKYLPGRKNLKFISDINSLNQEYCLNTLCRGAHNNFLCIFIILVMP